MKLPERILSTPRLIAVALTLALILLAIKGTVEAQDFLAVVTLVFGYFFGSRGSEKADGKTEKELDYKKTDELQEEISIHDRPIVEDKQIG